MTFRTSDFVPTRSSFGRTLARLLVVAQCASGVPALAATSRDVDQQAAGVAVQPKPETPRAPNRTVPKVSAPPTLASLPDTPTNAQVTHARIFPEPLIPMSRPTTAAENRALSRAIKEYARGKQSEMVAPLLAFLAQYPESAWRASLLANLGIVYRGNGYVGRALNAWDQAWGEAKSETDVRATAIADFALGEWMDLSAKIGRAAAISARLDEIRGRNVTGRAAQKVGMAREAVWVLTSHHEDAAASGPTALESILGYQAFLQHQKYSPSAALRSFHAVPAGTSLTELKTLANSLGLSFEMGFRPRDAEYPVPSVVHFRVDHYSAIVKHDHGMYLLLDPILGGEKWLSQEALDEESSGYFLARRSKLPADWRMVPDAEGSTVIGHCAPGAPDDTDPCPCGGGGGGAGMATYSLHMMQASLRLNDLPLTYAPALGPQAQFLLTYNQRDGLQPQIFSTVNIGPKWTFDWLSWVTDNPNSADVEADVYLRGGGDEHYTDGVAHPVYAPHWRTRAVLAKVSDEPVRYERRMPDGGVEVFTQSDGVITYGRHIYLTDVIDPQGLSLHITYDDQLRIVAITDASGLVTTVSYGLPSDPGKITKVTDPFGRSAALSYNSAGELASITDEIGLKSSFGYGPEDFIANLTTPYGRTLFVHEADQIHTTTFRFIQATDPLGGTERAEFRWTATDLPSSEPADQVPAALAAYNQNLNRYNTVYWDKGTMALYPGDVSKATVTHWLLSTYQSYTPVTYSHSFSSSVPHSMKRPLERRVWYAYPDQDINGFSIGSWVQPTKTARVLDDGSTQLWQASYNDLGHVTTRTDPLGRQTTYSYAANSIDLQQIRQTSNGISDLLATFSNYSSQHQPQTSVDAAGLSTTSTFNAVGQLTTTTNALGELTALTYDAEHRLIATQAPLGSIVSQTYDSYGRVRTQTGPDGYTTTMDYDAFDRMIRVSYPDGSFETRTYDRLDLVATQDRLGRTTRFFYDPMRRAIATRDPAGRTITQSWCPCGMVAKLIDANGNTTAWDHDVESRITRELRADGTTATLYAYESSTSRLKTVTDPKGQVTNYTYLVDDTLQQVAFTGAEHATHALTFTYDGPYNRVATMVDGNGTTTYTYKGVGVLGALQVASIDGPWTNDTITYDYDELGRVLGTAVNGVSRTQSYDGLGRVTSETNPLGTFGMTYVGGTGRVDQETYPNGQVSAYTYYPNSGDNRPQTIHHKRPDGTTLSKFDYTYDVSGHITTWSQQADSSAPTVHTYRYDPSSQLAGDVQSSADVATVLKRYAYSYDRAGNRTAEQVDDGVMQASYDGLNRLLNQQPGGAIRVVGQVSEPASVDINGKPAISADGKFEGTAATVPGVNTLTVTARDGSGNQQTNVYQITTDGSGKTFTYDANGNLTSDGTRTFEWDARNQLLAVTVGTHRTEFGYDGLHRRVVIREIDPGSTSERRYIWSGEELLEERDAATGANTRSFYARGFSVGSSPKFSTQDHLGSSRDVTNAAGELVARLDYDASGRVQRVAGSADVPMTFAGYWALDNGLQLSRYRAYDPETGRWISEDPSETFGGINLYALDSNDPINRFDPDGLASCQTVLTKLLDLQVFPYNDKRPAGDWELEDSDTDGPDQDVEHPQAFVPLSVLRCAWARRVLQTDHYRRFTFRKLVCKDCHGIAEYWQGVDVMDYTKQYYRTERAFTTVALPIILDTLLDPKAQCNKRGYPGRR